MELTHINALTSSFVHLCNSRQGRAWNGSAFESMPRITRPGQRVRSRRERLYRRWRDPQAPLDSTASPDRIGHAPVAMQLHWCCEARVQQAVVRKLSAATPVD